MVLDGHDSPLQCSDTEPEYVWINRVMTRMIDSFLFSLSFPLLTHNHSHHKNKESQSPHRKHFLVMQCYCYMLIAKYNRNQTQCCRLWVTKTTHDFLASPMSSCLYSYWSAPADCLQKPCLGDFELTLTEKLQWGICMGLFLSQIDVARSDCHVWRGRDFWGRGGALQHADIMQKALLRFWGKALW